MRTKYRNEAKGHAKGDGLFLHQYTTGNSPPSENTNLEGGGGWPSSTGGGKGREGTSLHLTKIGWLFCEGERKDLCVGLKTKSG